MQNSNRLSFVTKNIDLRRNLILNLIRLLNLQMGELIDKLQLLCTWMYALIQPCFTHLYFLDFGQQTIIVELVEEDLGTA